MMNTVIQTDEMVKELEAAAGELLRLLSSFDQERINTAPFEGSWTPAQVGQHLYKSYKGVPQLLQGPVKKTERDPAQNIGQIKKDFLDFSTKLKAPDFIVPESKAYDRGILLDQLQKALGLIGEAARSLDLTETCTAFSFPVYGELTRMEWVYFVICHTRRHNHQLGRMAEKL